MVLSMLLEYLYESSFWLRILFIVIGIVAIAGISENVGVTFWLFLYCVIQRTTLSVIVAFIPETPGWLFTIGLAIEIILAIIVIVMDLEDGPLCILRGTIFCYETWLVSSIVSRIVYNFITGFSIEGFVIIIIILIVISLFT